MKKALILTGSTGGGHIQAAKSLEAEFRSNGYEVITLDIFGSRGKFFNALICESYDFLVETLPKIYDKMYDFADRKYFNSDVARILLLEAKKNTKNTIETFDPDVIVGTHPFVVHIVKRFKKKGIINCPTISIITDFKAHYSYIDKSIDAYITASKFTSETVANRKIPMDRVFPYGIPVREDFKTCCPISEKKTTIDNILVMGGSMGSAGIIRTVEEITKNPRKLNLFVVCGRNEELKNQLEDKYKPLVESNQLQVIGFSNEIHKLMDACDLVITKPGGLTSSEAINKRIPMVIPFTFPGQEKENVEFLVEQGVAVHVPEFSELNTKINTLIENPNIFVKMKENMSSIAKDYSTENIVTLSDDLIAKYDDYNFMGDHSRHSIFPFKKGAI